MVGIAGPSGCGKTTFTNLLLKYYQPDSGTIFFDQHDSRGLDTGYLRRNIGIVHQDCRLFKGTIIENLRIAKPEASQEEILTAAQKARIDDFIMSLPKQYQHKVGERGVTISGGQKHRLALARVFLKNPPIIILDEAASSIDIPTGNSIVNELLQIKYEHTIIIIAHRLSLLEKADKIFFIKGGRLTGTPPGI